MKRTLTSIWAIIALIAFVGILATPAEALPKVINDVVKVDTGGVIDIEGGKLKMAGVEITATAAELNAMDGITATVTELNAMDGAVDGVGSATGSTETATESLAYIQKTIIVLDDTPIVVTDLTGSTNSCGGTKIYEFPEGQIYILGFQVEDFTFATNSVIDNDHGGDFSFGTTVGTGSDLSTTEIDLTDAKVSIDPVTNVTDAVSALDTVAESYFDGTATAKDVYCNILLDGGDIDADTTNTVDATVTIIWANLGDD